VASVAIHQVAKRLRVALNGEIHQVCIRQPAVQEEPRSSRASIRVAAPAQRVT